MFQFHSVHQQGCQSVKFSDFLDFIRILKISQDVHAKVVIFAVSHDKVENFWIVPNYMTWKWKCTGYDMKRPGIFLKNCWLVSWITEWFWGMIMQWFSHLYLIWLFYLEKRLTLNLVKPSLLITWMNGSWDPILLGMMIFINSN